MLFVLYCCPVHFFSAVILAPGTDRTLHKERTLMPINSSEKVQATETDRHESIICLTL
jgi:hypothetical protein